MGDNVEITKNKLARIISGDPTKPPSTLEIIIGWIVLAVVAWLVWGYFSADPSTSTASAPSGGAATSAQPAHENQFYVGGSVFLKDQVTPACVDRAVLERLLEVRPDGEVFRKMLRTAYGSGACTYLASQREIFVEDLSFFADPMRVRPRGSDQSLWVSSTRVLQAIKD